MAKRGCDRVVLRNRWVLLTRCPGLGRCLQVGSFKAGTKIPEVSVVQQNLQGP